MGRPARLSRTHPELQEGANQNGVKIASPPPPRGSRKRSILGAETYRSCSQWKFHAYAKCKSRRLCKVRAATFGVRGEADLIEAGLNGGTGRPSVSPSAGVAMGWVASITPANRSESRRSPTRNSRTAAQKEKAGFFDRSPVKPCKRKCPATREPKRNVGDSETFAGESPARFKRVDRSLTELS